jgi:hypothetical protein
MVERILHLQRFLVVKVLAALERCCGASITTTFISLRMKNLAPTMTTKTTKMQQHRQQLEHSKRVFRLIASIVMACWSIQIHTVVFQTPTSINHPLPVVKEPKIKPSFQKMWVGAKGRSVPADFVASSNYITSPEETRILIPQLLTTEVSSMLPLVYVITHITTDNNNLHDEVYGRAQLVRLAQTLQLDGGIYWIVVQEDDDDNKNQQKSRFTNLQTYLYSTGIPFAHVTTLSAFFQGSFWKEGASLSDKKHNHHNNKDEKVPQIPQLQFPPGMVYFTNWKHAYDYRLFMQLRRQYVANINHNHHHASSTETILVLDPNTCISFWKNSTTNTNTTNTTLVQTTGDPSKLLLSSTHHDDPIPWDGLAIPTTNVKALSKIIQNIESETKNNMVNTDANYNNNVSKDSNNNNNKTYPTRTFHDWFESNQSLLSSFTLDPQIIGMMTMMIPCIKTTTTSTTPYVWHLPTYKEAEKFRNPPRGKYAAPSHYGKLASKFP